MPSTPGDHERLPLAGSGHTEPQSVHGRARGSKEPANELSGTEWTRNSISVWSDIRKTAEEKGLAQVHPASFPEQLASRAISCFMSRSDRVLLDPFAGTGASIIAAKNAGKVGVGLEIYPRYARLAEQRLGQQILGTQSSNDTSRVICDDVRNLFKYVDKESVDFVITSPPYWDVLEQRRTADYKDTRSYGSRSSDLGRIRDYQKFLEALAEAFDLVCRALKPSKYCIVNVMDIRKRNHFFPFHSDLAQQLTEVGFLWDDLIVWDRRHEYNNMRPLGYPYVFRVNKVHEYLLVFRKPD